MQVQVKGKHFDVDGALRPHIEERLQHGVAKNFSEAIEASAVVAHEGHQYRTDCAAHVGTGIEVQSHCDAVDARASFDGAPERLEQQLRRMKRRLRDHRHTRSGKLSETGGPSDIVPGAESVNGSE